MFSAVISAFFNSSLTISNPFGDFRLIAIDFLLALNWRKYQGSSSGLPGRRRRPGSPRPGFSILTTSAPNHANTSVQVVPASNCVKSTTLTPCRKLNSWVLSLIAFPPDECCQYRAPYHAGLQEQPWRGCGPARISSSAERRDCRRAPITVLRRLQMLVGYVDTENSRHRGHMGPTNTPAGAYSTHSSV